MANSKGDPRVLFAMNLVLSTVFAYAVIWGLSFIDLLSFAWRSVGILTALLMILTYLVVR
jgi:hypothetical protein